ncbi:unnamed protein product [Symbiodinium natans]|uniref:PPM-type phosphatase domain-containing protein n=1 Tax=Symbiodinium natans TaxID=878477 RepID=A0A812J024_9DINO|nr:unnamed protein product [Symbiodinium natans]
MYDTERGTRSLPPAKIGKAFHPLHIPEFDHGNQTVPLKLLQELRGNQQYWLAVFPGLAPPMIPFGPDICSRSRIYRRTRTHFAPLRNSRSFWIGVGVEVDFWETVAQDAFRSTDDDIYAKMGSDVEYSGSTGVVVLVDKGQSLLTAANVGDSRAVLGRLEGSQWRAVPLTTDLKPEMPEERERIELSGGVVCQYRDGSGEEAGPFRVWDGPCCEKPGLAVSRSLGDGAARALGVIAAPVVTKHRLLKGQDKFLIIATDGLWDSVDNEEAVRIVAKFQTMPSIALKALTEAVRRAEGDELVDDTTILLIHFRE